MIVLVTGSSGFVGTHLTNSSSENITFRTVSLQSTPVEQIDFTDIDVVVHMAALVHQMNELDEKKYFEVNVDLTLELAKVAHKNNVKRFIFLSTIKVNGESTLSEKPFLFNDIANPQDPYSRSKKIAEDKLKKYSADTGMEYVIIRPPLIYGAGVKGNFRSLIAFVNKGRVSPFGLVNSNKRSMLSVYNLVDLIKECIVNNSAANNTFLASDGRDLSTAELMTLISNSLNITNISIPVPVWVFKLLGRVTGKKDVIDRIIGNLQVNIDHTKNVLGWEPQNSIESGLYLTTEAVRKKNDSNG